MRADEDDRDLLIQAARAAGEVAMRYFRNAPKVWDKGGDQGPVTEADLEVNAVLEAHLRAARPHYAWLSEESPPSTDRMTASDVFVIDPIDGTRAFIEGTSAFAHSIAVVRDGAVTAGVVFLPAQDRLYAAARGAGATLNGTTIKVSATQLLDAANLLSAKPAFNGKHWPGGLGRAKRSYRPSLAYRLCLVAEGRFDGMITLRDAWEWDIAAGTLIVREAGGTVTDGAGRSMPYNSASASHQGCLAATPDIHAALMEARSG
ncbi:MAG: 3'(2'),5'-bisphosphate nucleotidase CysQ [Pseudomonadota bacterium]